LPDTAETEWLDRHAQIWLVNADGTVGRKQPTPSQGSVTVTGIPLSILPLAAELTSANGVNYETTQQITIGVGPTAVTVRAIDYGSQGNQLPGAPLALTNPVDGVDGGAIVVALDGGTDQETDSELRARVLRRIQQPPMGGAAGDYEAWALAVPGVTRAWSSPNEMGVGTVTVRFLMDDLRAADDGWPQPQDIAAVADYVDKVRPVAVKDCYVVAPIKQFLDITIANLVPDTTEAQAEIEQSLRNMLFVKAAPGQTIFASWISYAIMSAPSVQSFQLVTDADYVMPAPGYMAVLGTILYHS
jgi:uncharacterized phage protein gp47/JayE